MKLKQIQLRTTKNTPSSNNGNRRQESFKIKGSCLFVLCRDVTVMLRNQTCYFSYLKISGVEIPAVLW